MPFLNKIKSFNVKKPLSFKSRFIRMGPSISSPQEVFYVSMNNAGTRFVTGSLDTIRLYDWNTTSKKWDFKASKSFTQIGGGIALSGNGNRIIVGEPYAAMGQVSVWEWNGTSFSQTGNWLYAEYQGDAGFKDAWGAAVAINDAGDRIVVGAPEFDNGNANLNYAIGQVKVFSLSGSTWSQLGSTILGTDQADRFGQSVAMTSSGTRIIGGTTNSDGPGDTNPVIGQVRVFDTSSSTRVGQILYGQQNFDKAGAFVSINDAGNRIAITSSRAPLGGQNGAVIVYDLNGSTWSYIGGGSIYGAENDNVANGTLDSVGNRLVFKTNTEIKLYLYDSSTNSWSLQETDGSFKNRVRFSINNNANRIAFTNGTNIEVYANYLEQAFPF